VAVFPRRVTEAALHRSAFGRVLSHNHPNGQVTPSEPDKVLTRAIVRAAQAISLRVVDHLTVSSQETFSFRKEGLL
jgi:DNA repair protein RadC